MGSKHVAVDMVAVAQNILTKALQVQREDAKAHGGKGTASFVDMGKGTFVIEGSTKRVSPTQAILSTLRAKGAAEPVLDRDWFKAHEFPVTFGQFGQMIVAPKGLLEPLKARANRTQLAVDFTA